MTVAVVVVALVSGTGGDGGALNAIAEAAEVTQREPGGDASIEATVTVGSTGEGINESGSLTFERDGRSSATLTVTGLTNGKEITADAIADGTVSYMRSAALDWLPEGKTWMKLDLSRAVSGVEMPAQQASPEEGLKVLETVEDAHEVGAEEIDGESTTHYTGTAQVAKEVFGVKASYSAPEVDVWVDSQNRVRKMAVLVEGELSGVAGSSTRTELTVEYLHFGQVPKIELPPADEVFDATDKVEAELQAAAEGG